MHLVAAELAFDLVQPVEFGAHLGDLRRREDIGHDEVALLVELAALFGSEIGRQIY